MTTLIFLGAHRNVNRSLPTGLVNTFRRKKFDEKLPISPLSVREFLKWAVGPDTGSLKQFLVVLKAKKKSRRLQNFASLFAATSDLLLREAGKK